MGACAVSAAILYKKTIPRPKGVDMAIVDEFADKEKFEEYMEKSVRESRRNAAEAWKSAADIFINL